MSTQRSQPSEPKITSLPDHASICPSPSRAYGTVAPFNIKRNTKKADAGLPSVTKTEPGTWQSSDVPQVSRGFDIAQDAITASSLIGQTVVKRHDYAELPPFFSNCDIASPEKSFPTIDDWDNNNDSNMQAQCNDSSTYPFLVFRSSDRDNRPSNDPFLSQSPKERRTDSEAFGIRPFSPSNSLSRDSWKAAVPPYEQDSSDLYSYPTEPHSQRLNSPRPTSLNTVTTTHRGPENPRGKTGIYSLNEEKLDLPPNKSADLRQSCERSESLMRKTPVETKHAPVSNECIAAKQHRGHDTLKISQTLSKSSCFRKEDATRAYYDMLSPDKVTSEVSLSFREEDAYHDMLSQWKGTRPAPGPITSMCKDESFARACLDKLSPVKGSDCPQKSSSSSSFKGEDKRPALPDMETLIKATCPQNSSSSSFKGEDEKSALPNMETFLQATCPQKSLSTLPMPRAEETVGVRVKSFLEASRSSQGLDPSSSSNEDTMRKYYDMASPLKDLKHYQSPSFSRPELPTHNPTPHTYAHVSSRRGKDNTPIFGHESSLLKKQKRKKPRGFSPRRLLYGDEYDKYTSDELYSPVTWAGRHLPRRLSYIFKGKDESPVALPELTPPPMSKRLPIKPPPLLPPLPKIPVEDEKSSSPQDPVVEGCAAPEPHKERENERGVVKGGEGQELKESEEMDTDEGAVVHEEEEEEEDQGWEKVLLAGETEMEGPLGQGLKEYEGDEEEEEEEVKIEDDEVDDDWEIC